MKMTLFIGSLCNGGAERVISGLANYLAKDNEITLLTVSNLKPEYELSESVSWKTLDGKNKSRFKKNMHRLLALFRYVKENEADIYIVFLPVTSYLILCLRRFIKGKIIISIRNDPKEEYSGWIHKALVRLLFPKADGVVFQTDEQRKYFDEKVIKNYRIIPNPISEKFLKDKKNMLKKEKRIISVGRLTVQKNFELLIAAFAELSEEYPDHYLMIFGEGSERAELEKYIREKGIENKCFLPGRSNEIQTELLKSEIFVSTSDYEGISNALLEAMACGLPVITTDWSGGGARILVEDGINGIIIPVRDEARLVQEINALLSDRMKQKALSQKALKVKKDFSTDAIYKIWKDYIDEIYILCEGV